MKLKAEKLNFFFLFGSQNTIILVQHKLGKLYSAGNDDPKPTLYVNTPD